jgi:hypothetical protein
MKIVFSAIAFIVLASILTIAAGPDPTVAADFGMRGYAIYYNDFLGATTIYFRQTTAETTYRGSNSWMIRNPNAAGSTNIILLTGSSTTTGITIPPLATFSGKDYRNSVKLYAAASTAVELYVESDE